MIFEQLKNIEYISELCTLHALRSIKSINVPFVKWNFIFLIKKGKIAFLY